MKKAPKGYEEQIKLWNEVTMFKDEITHSFAWLGGGISAWFQAFLQSPDFAKLSNEDKADAFTLYRELQGMFSLITQHDLTPVE